MNHKDPRKPTTWICLVGDLFALSTMGFITIKSPPFGRIFLTFSRHRTSKSMGGFQRCRVQKMLTRQLMTSNNWIKTTEHDHHLL